MMDQDRADDSEREKWLQHLMDIELPTSLPPHHRLLLAVLKQSVLDYFGDDPVEALDAQWYFAESSVYRTTLQLFNLPDDLLPHGVDVSGFRRKTRMNANKETDPLKLETLVRQLSGTQLKIVLTMGLLSLPAVTKKISLQCGVSRSTALVALDQMTLQGLVVREEMDGRAVWSFADEVRRLVAEVWGTQGGSS